MNTYKASDFARNPKPKFNEALNKPIVIQRCGTNGEIEDEFVLIKKSHYCSCVNSMCKMCNPR